MLLVKKCQFFHYLFLLKIRLEIRFNNVPDRKETFFEYQNKTLQSPKRLHFFKRVNPCFWSKTAKFFLYLNLVKIRLEKVSNNILEKKETFFTIKTKIFDSPINHIFPKGLTHAFGQKMPIFSLFVFA